MLRLVIRRDGPSAKSLFETQFRRI